MKALNEVELKKIVTWSLIVVFSFLQILPTGWAAQRPISVEELQARSVPSSAVSVDNPEVPPVVASQHAAAPLDSIQFQVSDNPLSRPAPKAHLETKVQQPEMTLPPVYRVVPPDTKVITDPRTGRELSVTFDEHGVATVKWGDQEYKGYYDPRTNSINIVTQDNSIWTLQYERNETGQLTLKSFQTQNWNNGYATETYTFNSQGQLIRKDWFNEQGNYYWPLVSKCSFRGGCFNPVPNGYRSGGTMDYVTINGKTLVSHEKTWSENKDRYWYEGINDHNFLNYSSNRSETETWYSYDNQGNLLGKSWHSHDGDGNQTFGQEEYIHINGRDLVSVRRVWNYSNNRFDRDYFVTRPIYDLDLSHVEEVMPTSIRDYNIFIFEIENSYAETYYKYDSNGNMIAEVSAWENYNQNGQRHSGASYWIYNASNGTWETASVDNFEMGKIRSADDWKLIEAAAQRKTVHVGGSIENRFVYTHRIEYTRNNEGTMIAKAVYEKTGDFEDLYIVQGEPDILSGEIDDIKFIDVQKVNGYTVYFEDQGRYWNGSLNDGYKLVFRDSNWEVVAAVDFPKDKTVELNGKKYEISVNKDGILELKEHDPAQQAIRQAVKAGLVNTFGFSLAMLDQLIKDGKIVITVDLEKLTATVTIDPSVTLPSGAVNLTDPLGLRRLPGKIHYELGSYTFEMGAPCSPEGDCPHASPIYFLKSGSFYVGFDYFVKMDFLENDNIHPVASFGDNRLYHVSVSKIDNPCGGNSQCMAPVTITLIQDISFKYDDKGITAHIVYQDGSQNGIITRDVVITKMEDGQYHIQTVVEKDGSGKIIAKNVFVYGVAIHSPCTQEGCDPDFVMLQSIIRTDANGNPLSEITFENGKTVLRLRGVSKEVTFTNFQDLLDQASRFEKENRIPPEVQAYVDQLKQALANGFRVEVNRHDFGQGPEYWISVLDNKQYPQAPTVGLKSMTFRLVEQRQCTSADVCHVIYDLENTHIFQMYYYGSDGRDIALSSDYLYRAMSMCPEGQVCPAMNLSSIDILKKLSEIVVTHLLIPDETHPFRYEIHFKMDGKNYRVYGKEGRVVLELMPPDPEIVAVVRQAVNEGLVEEKNQPNENILSPLALKTLTLPRLQSRKARSFALASTLGMTSSLLRESPLKSVEAAETTALFAFEQGGLLFSKLLRELTK